LPRSFVGSLLRLATACGEQIRVAAMRHSEETLMPETGFFNAGDNTPQCCPDYSKEPRCRRSAPRAYGETYHGRQKIFAPRRLEAAYHRADKAIERIVDLLAAA
jgi:hypothetical protein